MVWKRNLRGRTESETTLGYEGGMAICVKAGGYVRGKMAICVKAGGYVYSPSAWLLNFSE